MRGTRTRGEGRQEEEGGDRAGEGEGAGTYEEVENKAGAVTDASVLR